MLIIDTLHGHEISVTSITGYRGAMTSFAKLFC